MGGRKSTPAAPPPAPVKGPLPPASDAVARKRRAEERADAETTGATKKLLGQ
jgi:hypothetical protein